jgi:hypothetical protein
MKRLVYMPAHPSSRLIASLDSAPAPRGISRPPSVVTFCGRSGTVATASGFTRQASIDHLRASSNLNVEVGHHHLFQRDQIVVPDVPAVEPADGW